MTVPGLALFYGGLVRAENVLSVLMQCFAICCLATVLWFACVYSLAFSDGGALNAWIGGLSKMFLSGVGADSMSGDIPENVFFMFQMTFAIITPGLIVARLRGTHQVPRRPAVQRNLADRGLCPGLPLGLGRRLAGRHGGHGFRRRYGRPHDGRRVGPGRRRAARQPHGLPDRGQTAAQSGHDHDRRLSMLWVGWFGFNAGSALAADGSAAMAMVVTQISAATASLVWMIAEWKKFGKPSLAGLVTGTIGGLATITPASGFVGPVGALIIGVAAGLVCFGAVQVIKPRFNLDDTLDVFAVHGVGGIIGSLMTAFLALEIFGGGGLAEGMGVGQAFWVQSVGVLATGAWAGIGSWAILKAIDATVGLRVSQEQEFEGLDITTHGERAYEI